jgi:hypothetical protein
MNRIIAVLASCVIVFGCGYASHTYSSATPSPRPCSVGSNHVPSGDAMRTDENEEDVCTDGTWVAVTSYGN